MNIRSILGNTLSKLYIKAEELYIMNILQKVFDYFTKNQATFSGTVDFTNATVTGLAGGDPRPYKVYTALLFQYGSDAPVATVLESTLSDAVSWVRTGAGVYNIGGNTEISRGVLVSHRSLNFSTNVEVGYILSFNGAELYTQRLDNLNYSDNLLDSTLIEIRVYD